jgi:2-polyprenyl-3-methyl-5-hydroxy-6-metoxy-1,4-benzoquinol methylase
MPRLRRLASSLQRRSSVATMSADHDHWDAVYGRQSDDAVSWFQAEPATSLRLVRRAAVPPASVVDAGAGASKLVDRLLEVGYSDVTVVDVSETALRQVQGRLPDASSVRLIRTDLLALGSGTVLRRMA